jgi:phosphoribosylanthranilate isomerase
VTTLQIQSSLIKICGVTSLDDAREVVRAGANALGLNFADVPRRVSVEVAVTISERTGRDLVRVAVFRDRSDQEILDILTRVDVDAVQLHDHLSDDLLTALRERGHAVIKALSITSDEFIAFDDVRVDAVLIDGPRAGSGETHAWTPLHERAFRVPWIAAGGLTPGNVAAVIREWSPWGVDVASGVESAPGVKDVVRVGNFVANARRALNQKESLS